MRQTLPIQIPISAETDPFAIAPTRHKKNYPLRVLLIGSAAILFGLIGGIIAGVEVEGLMSALISAITILVATIVMTIYWPIFDLRTFRIPGVFVITQAILIVMPIPMVYVNNSSDQRITYVLATCMGLLCTILGIVLTHYAFPSHRQRATHWLAAPIHLSPILRPIAIVLLVGCLGVLLLYVRHVGSLPIVQAISGGSSAFELALAREDALKLISGKIRYLFGSTRNMLFPYTTLLILSITFTTRRWFWKILLFVSALGTLMFASATLEKSPVGAFFIMLMVAIMILRRKKLSFSTLPLLAIAALIFPVFVVMALYQFDIDAYRIVAALSRRIFYVPSEVLFYYFDFVPNQQFFLFGRTLPYVSKLFPNGPFPIVTIVCQYAYQSSLTSCSANAAYLGTLWADFSWLGIFAGGLLAGVLIQGLQTFTMRLPKSPQTVALQSMLVYQVIMLTSASLPDFLESTGALYAFILTCAISLIAHKPNLHHTPE